MPIFPFILTQSFMVIFWWSHHNLLYNQTNINYKMQTLVIPRILWCLHHIHQNSKLEITWRSCALLWSKSSSCRCQEITGCRKGKIMVTITRMKNYSKKWFKHAETINKFCISVWFVPALWVPTDWSSWRLQTTRRFLRKQRLTGWRHLPWQLQWKNMETKHHAPTSSSWYHNNNKDTNKNNDNNN